MARIKDLRAFQARCDVVDFCLLFEQRFNHIYESGIFVNNRTVIPYVPLKKINETRAHLIPERHDHESYDACMEYLCESVHCNPVT